MIILVYATLAESQCNEYFYILLIIQPITSQLTSYKKYVLLSVTKPNPQKTKWRKLALGKFKKGNGWTLCTVNFISIISYLRAYFI